VYVCGGLVGVGCWMALSARIDGFGLTKYVGSLGAELETK